MPDDRPTPRRWLHPLRWLTGLWRNSLQRRVVLTTVACGLLAISVVGTYIYQQIADGLTSDRIKSAEVEARSLLTDATTGFENNSTQGLEELNNFSRIQIQKLAPPPPDLTRFVVFTPALTNSSASRLSTVVTGGLTDSPVPRDLREAVDADPSRQRTAVISFDRSALLTDSAQDASGSSTVPAVVVGAQVDVRTAGVHELFFIYPMDREQNTLALVRRVFYLGLGALLTMLALIAWLTSRQVVRPVQRAADVAERLAAGNLNERMVSTGADEMAVLGRSFNDMADHLQSQIRQLEELSQVQQIFVSDVSHELRTPLTTIRMAADVMHARRADFAPELARSAELLSTELDRFENLLTDLLEISRFDAKAANLEVDPVDLGGVVRRSVQAVSALAVAKGSPVRVETPGVDVIAEIDVRRVERILRNLLVNAIEHGEGLPIVVSVAGNETAVAVAVRDQGVGLRPGDAAKVFNRFWRADPARARTTGGTGLGLAISLEDARLHHGWLEAWGRPGQGTVFRLTLPRAPGGFIESSPLHLIPAAGAHTESDVTTKLRPVKRDRNQP
jgi:two-component system sensor histidine kinase MtrB